MKNPLIINVRCTCIEEYVRMLDLHEQFRKQKSEGEILSIYVGATPAMYGKSPLIDKMLDKVFGDGAKPIPTERITKEKVIAAQGNGDGNVAETVEQTIVSAEKPLTVDEARVISTGEAVEADAFVGEFGLQDFTESEPRVVEASDGSEDGADWSIDGYAG